jgi:hypothetical protein
MTCHSLIPRLQNLRWLSFGLDNAIRISGNPDRSLRMDSYSVS